MGGTPLAGAQRSGNYPSFTPNGTNASFMSPMFLQFANEMMQPTPNQHEMMQPTPHQQFSSLSPMQMPWFGGAPSCFHTMKPPSDNKSMMMALVSSQFDAMLESEEAHKREMKLRHEFELDVSRKQNMMLRKQLFLSNMQQSM